MSRAKTILLYSESGNAKTSQCVHLARYIKRKYNKNTRLISSDGGGWSSVEDEGLLYNAKTNPTGIVDAFNMTNRAKYLADWRKLSTGLWPRVVKGDSSIGEDNTKGYRKFIGTTSEEWKGIGCYFIEGLTSVGSGFISHISKQDNSKDSITKVMYSAPGYDEDGEHFGATDQGHIGMVQNELHNLTQQFGTLPVELVVWTALVGQATAKALRKVGIAAEDMTLYFGPQLSGNAKTAEAPSWFSDCLHLERQDDSRIFVFFKRHKTNDGNVYLAKSSTGPSIYPRLEERFPGGYFELGFREGEGVDRYLNVIDEIKGEKLK